MLDDDGYLFLTGRLKEQINRGGEKISPLEIDEVLLRHPAVAEAVTFAIPHDKLGEEVGAAVVLAEGHVATEDELREFLRRQLAAFKVPKQIVVRRRDPQGRHRQGPTHRPRGAPRALTPSRWSPAAAGPAPAGRPLAFASTIPALGGRSADMNDARGLMVVGQRARSRSRPRSEHSAVASADMNDARGRSAASAAGAGGAGAPRRLAGSSTHGV